MPNIYIEGPAIKDLDKKRAAALEQKRCLC